MECLLAMESDAKSPLLSSHNEKDTSQDNSEDKDDNINHKLKYILGIAATLLWVSCSAFSAIFVQVSTHVAYPLQCYQKCGQVSLELFICL